MDEREIIFENNKPRLNVDEAKRAIEEDGEVVSFSAYRTQPDIVVVQFRTTKTTLRPIGISSVVLQRLFQTYLGRDDIPPPFLGSPSNPK